MAATTSTGMNLPSIMHYLQTEFSRYERDRNFWELERAEMKARIAKLEGERKGNERMKDWYARRLRMMEAALHEERVKTNPEAEKPPSEVPDSKPEKRSKRDRMEPVDQDESFLEVLRSSQEALKDQRGRTKARTYLEKCLTEVTYLVSANPTISANRPGESGIPPLKADTTILEDDMDQQSVLLINQNSIRSASPPTVPSRRLPSPAPLIFQSDTGSNGIVNETGAEPVAPTDTPLDEIALEEQEQVERIQHVYDKNGHFVDSFQNDMPSAPVVDADEEFERSSLSSDDANSRETGRAENHERSAANFSATDDSFDYELETTMYGHKKAVKVVRAFTQGRHLWVASAGTDSVVRIHRDRGEEPYQNLHGHTGTITSLAWYESANNEVSLFSAGEDMVIRRWVLSSDGTEGFSMSSEPTTTYVSHSQTIMAIATVKNKVVSGSMDGSIRSWDILTGESQKVWWLPEHENASLITCVASCGDSTFVVSYTDGQVRHYDTENHKFCHALIPRKEHAAMSQINALLAKHKADGHHLVITAHEDKKIRIYDIKTRSLLHLIDGHRSHISSLSFLPTSTAPASFASTSHDRTVHVWSLETGARLGTVDALSSDVATHGVASISAVAMPAGDDDDKEGTEESTTRRHRLASAGADGSIRIYIITS